MIDEATGKIAICSSDEVHIYKPYGKKEDALKVEPEMHRPPVPIEVLTSLIVVFSVLLTRFEPRQRNINTFMGVGGRVVNRVLFSEALPDCGR